jgi:S-(hydroxymethyl)glutathione dehydrogenase / alcohol dehydrogenase
MIPRYVEFYLRGQLKLDLLVTASFPIERVNDALAATQNAPGARSIISFG